MKNIMIVVISLLLCSCSHLELYKTTADNTTCDIKFTRFFFSQDIDAEVCGDKARSKTEVNAGAITSIAPIVAPLVK